MRRILPLLAFLLACAPGAPRPDSATVDPAPPASAPAPVVRAIDSVAPGRIVLRRARERDLTGDGRAERLEVIASGPAFDTLDVRVAVLAADGAPLHLARWSASRYFHYDPREGKADSTVERIVRGYVDRLLADSAFLRRDAAPPERAVIAHDLGEARIQWQRGRADTLPSPYDLVTWNAGRAGEPPRATSALADSLVAELTGRPVFGYFAGGEESYVLAWSDRLGRFVRVFACC